MPDVYVAAGSNVEPGPRLRQALALLRERFDPLTLSPAYRNPAVGFAGDDFVNLAIGFATDDSVHEVIAQLQAIEMLCGRPRAAPKWAPRAMDLDILLYGDLVSAAGSGLTLPRPDLVRRPYMLKPMADIASGVRHPVLGKTLGELWNEYRGDKHPLEPMALELL